jgi:hypothetical protein
MAENKLYKIKLTSEDGKTRYWHKFGSVHLLPEDLANTWVAHFKPAIFQVTDAGELVAVGRSPVPSFQIVKVEKEPA